ncbi:aminoglycoside phosphotransferase family protein [Acidobacteria bacterium AB60]|nr:aminoglycoside phosphotransferase family protein [Acidobacteria bacterium AB60]
MEVRDPNEIAAAARQFRVSGEFAGAARYGSGHINESYRAIFREGAREQHFLLQRINTRVFPDVDRLMQNIERVTERVSSSMEAKPDRERRALRLIRTHDDRVWHRDAAGGCWRMYPFVNKARALDTIESAEQAYQIGRAFGEFQQQLANMPPPRLHDTIPDFHHTPKRYAALEEAIARDVAGRARFVEAEIGFARRRKPITTRLLDAGLPERITHNDTKCNNVLLDEATNEAICVIDLDTVMPGLAGYDFGDMVRTMTSPAAEDERDLSRVYLRLPVFEAIVRGYLSAAGAFLTREEKESLPLAGKLITFEIGIRFLTDYLSGDNYFRIHRPDHNLDRCRTQFKLVESIEQNEAALNTMVEQCG